jgi:toxin YhaV
VLFNEPFLSRYRAMSARARELKQRLSPAEYERHRDVKAFLAVRRVITDVVPANPHDPDFLLTGPLAKFRRVKGHGLPDRLRLFFVFSTQAKALIFIYLNDESTLRQQGGRKDPYVVFSNLVERGEIGDDFDANYERWRRRQTTGR